MTLPYAVFTLAALLVTGLGAFAPASRPVDRGEAANRTTLTNVGVATMNDCLGRTGL